MDVLLVEVVELVCPGLYCLMWNSKNSSDSTAPGGYYRGLLVPAAVSRGLLNHGDQSCFQDGPADDDHAITAAAFLTGRASLPAA